ncbi:hypothetical protein [Kitasatospora cheerisanensis]|uniref:Uncharacterized protein n=1 Tax=Kitasatospora cheerisanensis KCTC 2395 TaxID=1348663 RepID=A0A066Z8X0_9ACTN|nr:hypothetical protein [Kitasatospora cheerisanensis]KDN86771.1 hypothetical protein KCH_15050 [Kitasatospora cheerisanensis KCTC 2395]
MIALIASAALAVMAGLLARPRLQQRLAARRLHTEIRSNTPIRLPRQRNEESR